MRGAISVAGAIVFGCLLAVPLSVAGPGPSIAVLFERTWGNSTADATAIGPDGSVYVAGLTVVGEYPVQDLDATLLRFTAAGVLMWARSWRGFADESAKAVAVDAAGAAYVTGMTTSFGTEAFLLKFDASGNLEWQRTWGGPREDGGEAVAIGADGGVYVTGFTQNFGTFPGAVTFLLKFTTAGAVVWERTWETSAGGLPRDLAAAPDGSIYIGGLTYPRGYIAKFSASGSLLWDRTYLAHAPTGVTDFEGIGVTPDGGVVAVGQYIPTFDQQVLIVRFAPDGRVLLARSWGGESGDVAVDAVVTADGTTYVVGETDPSFSSNVYEDFFVLEMNPSGRVTEARTWGGVRRETPQGIALGPSGDLYIAGSAGDPPYTFGGASSQTFRVRNSTLTDPAALVGVPTGTIGTPDGVVGALEVTEPSPFGGAVLLCLSLG